MLLAPFRMHRRSFQFKRGGLQADEGALIGSVSLQAGTIPNVVADN